jgi:methyltransferase (TIGR00027 family)
MTTNQPITHVSDTALWVAMYRALESDRPDALFKDPLARRLAGELGESILDGIPKARAMAWPMIVRTALLDELVMRSVTEGGFDTVVNLAAGLDTRPYRLPIPSSVRWIEVDLPDMVEYKRARLGDEKPVCALEVISADLANPADRDAVLKRLGGGTVLVITEGLLVYLDPSDVEKLATALHAHSPIKEWILDLGSPRLLKMLEKTWGPTLRAGNAPFRFAPGEGTAFFVPMGWKELEFRPLFEESVRLNRSMGFAKFWLWLGRFSPQKRREEFRRLSGVVRLGRA